MLQDLFGQPVSVPAARRAVLVELIYAEADRAPARSPARWALLAAAAAANTARTRRQAIAATRAALIQAGVHQP
jgi:hypothetical protein